MPYTLLAAPRDEVIHVVGGRGFLGAAVVRALQRAVAHSSVSISVGASGREGIPPDEQPRITTLLWCAGRRAAELGALWRDHVEAPLAAVSALPALRAVVYVSSAEIYGAQPVPYPETAPRLGASAYARAKIFGEDALASLCWQRSLALAIARPGVLYGPGQAPSMLIPEAIERLSRRQPLLATAGDQTRDWLFVDDAAAALAMMATRRATGIYNLGSGQERSVRQLLEQLVALLEPRSLATPLATGDARDAATGPLVQWGARPYREDETMRYALAIDRARAELGWSPTTTLEAGLAACVRAHPSTPSPSRS